MTKKQTIGTQRGRYASPVLGTTSLYPGGVLCDSQQLEAVEYDGLGLNQGYVNDYSNLNE